MESFAKTIKSKDERPPVMILSFLSLISLFYSYILHSSSTSQLVFVSISLSFPTTTKPSLHNYFCQESWQPAQYILSLIIVCSIKTTYSARDSKDFLGVRGWESSGYTHTFYFCSFTHVQSLLWLSGSHMCHLWMEALTVSASFAVLSFPLSHFRWLATF